MYRYPPPSLRKNLREGERLYTDQKVSKSVKGENDPMKPLNLICKLLEKCTYQSDNENEFEETGVTAVMLYRDCSICRRCGLERLVSRRYRNNGSRTWGSCGGHCRNRGRPRKSHPYKVPVGVCSHLCFTARGDTLDDVTRYGRNVR